MYAVAASCGDTSIMLMSDHSGSAGGVTFVQLAPPSREMCTRPSSEPAQKHSRLVRRTRRRRRSSRTSRPPEVSNVTGPPEGPSFDASFRVRSGLIGRPAAALISRSERHVPGQRNSTRGSWGENWMG